MFIRGLFGLLTIVATLTIVACAPNTQLREAIGTTRPIADSDGQSAVVSRTFEEDGSVLITYADQRKRRVFSGGRGWEMIAPDGTIFDSRRYSPMQVPSADLPDFPDSSEAARWLRGHSDRLLGIMTDLVDNNQRAIEHYLDSEGANTPLQRQITRRTEAISYLLFDS